MGDGLSDLEIGQFLAAMVDFDHQLIGQRLVTIGYDLDACHLRDTVEICQRHGGKGGELDFLCFERRRGARPVWQNAIDDLIELRLVLAPIIGIAGQAIIFAGLVFRKNERPGADRLGIGRVGGDIGALIKMFRHDAGNDRQRVADELERRWLGEAEDRRVVIRRVHLLEIGKDQPSEILQRFPDGERRKGHVCGGKGFAIVPGHALAQLEGGA